jgi:hypothetical protein
MLPFTVYLKGQSQPVQVKADSFEFNFTPRNAEEIEPKLLFLMRGEETAAVFLLEELQGFVAPSE